MLDGFRPCCAGFERACRFDNIPFLHSQKPAGQSTDGHKRDCNARSGRISRNLTALGIR